eukprot:6761262-Alexandrium_andersonii.AAC.1
MQACRAVIPAMSFLPTPMPGGDSRPDLAARGNPKRLSEVRPALRPRPIVEHWAAFCSDAEAVVASLYQLRQNSRLRREALKRFGGLTALA